MPALMQKEPALLTKAGPKIGAYPFGGGRLAVTLRAIAQDWLRAMPRIRTHQDIPGWILPKYLVCAASTRDFYEVTAAWGTWIR